MYEIGWLELENYTKTLLVAVYIYIHVFFGMYLSHKDVVQFGCVR